jgi:hypothetical protein
MTKSLPPSYRWAIVEMQSQKVFFVVLRLKHIRPHEDFPATGLTTLNELVAEIIRSPH